MNTMALDEAYLYLRESLQALRAHHNHSSGQESMVRFKAELRRSPLGPNTTHFQVWWVDVPSRVANAFIWDAFNVEATTPADIDNFIEEARKVPSLQISEKEVSRAICKPVQDVPLFRYQPQRFRALVPFAKRLAQLSGSTTMFSS